MLIDHWTARHNVTIKEMFVKDNKRFNRFSLQLDDLLFDFSKTTLTDSALKLLFNLAQSANVDRRRDLMFAGGIVNKSESRPALHTALRAQESEIIKINGKNIMPAIAYARHEMLAFAQSIRDGSYSATDGGAFADVINIGIGGSCLGPAMAVAALAPDCDGPRVHFVANMDGAHLADTLKKLDPRRSLVIISSKTFTTLETIENAKRAHNWLVAAIGDINASKHLIAITAAVDKAQAFGIKKIFSYPWSIGGRYSVWGAGGLPLAIAIGANCFSDFLDGALEMDNHFCHAPITQNIPIMLGLVGIWHRNICDYPTRAILPYDQRLYLLPEYLQQVDMESNGKNARQQNINYAPKTAPITWGSVGSNAQHAYFQLLHQGTDIAPCEFLIAAKSRDADKEQHRLLVANCLAQSATLMLGDDSPPAPERRFAGDRPSITLLYRQLTPRALGRLMALFEHRAFVEGTIWDINPFDQWGVELGKSLAKTVAVSLTTKNDKLIDSSIQGLTKHYHNLLDK